MASDERCPYCAGVVARTDKVCPHCQRQLTGRALLENPPDVARAIAATAAGAPPPHGAKYCLTCGTIAVPRRDTRGSFLIEVFLWLLLIVPGLVYSLWRLTTRRWVCPACKSDQIIPLDSPKAQSAIAASRQK